MRFGDEVVRLWIRKDRDAALVWMGLISETSGNARRAQLSRCERWRLSNRRRPLPSPDEFGIGRDDGSLEHIVQIWAAENF